MAIKELTDSKKFLASVLASLVIFAGVYFADLSLQEAMAIASPLLVYTGAQAVADWGKEAELVRQAGKGLRKENGD